MADYNWYIAEAEKNYEPARQSIRNQINAIGGQRQAALDDLNKQYGLQQSELDRQQSQYGVAAEQNASRKGLGWSNIGQNYKADYAANTYRPAVQSLQTNQQNDIRNTNENYTNRQFSLENTLNSLYDEARRWGQQQYNAALDREAQERAARAAAAAQQAALSNYLGGGGGSGAGQSQSVRNMLQAKANAGDLNAKIALDYVGDDGRYYIDWNNPNNVFQNAYGADQVLANGGARYGGTTVSGANQLARILDQFGFRNAYTG
jgi:hypothetical protein